MPTDQFRDIRNSRRIKNIFQLPEVERSLTLNHITDIISYAIQKNYKVDFFYQDDMAGGKILRGYRSVSPVAIGTHRTSGNVVFRGYLLEGVSKSKRNPKWRLWRLDRVTAIRLFTIKQVARFDKLYRPNDKHMDFIYEQAGLSEERIRSIEKRVKNSVR